MNAGEMTDKELMKVSGEAEELLAGASMLRSADVVGELRRRYLLLLAEKSAAKMENEKVKVEGEGEQRTLNTFEEHKANDGDARIIHAKREGLRTMTAIVVRRGGKCLMNIFDADGRCVVTGDIISGMTTANHVARSAMRAIMKRKKHLQNMRAKKRAKKEANENGQDQQ